MERDIAELLKEFATTSIGYLLPEDAELTVNVVKSTKNITIQLETQKENRGRVIGKGGATIDALKTLFISVKNTYTPEDRRKVNVEIIEDDDYFSRSK